MISVVAGCERNLYWCCGFWAWLVGLAEIDLVGDWSASQPWWAFVHAARVDCLRGATSGARKGVKALRSMVVGLKVLLEDG